MSAHACATTPVPGPACPGPASRSGLGTTSPENQGQVLRLDPAVQLGVCGGHGLGGVGPGPRRPCGGSDPDGSG